MGKSVEVLNDYDGLIRRAAELFVDIGARALRENGRFSIALCGGNTPRGLYRLLSDKRRPFRARIPWRRIHFFWGDERAVPPDHPSSNYRTALEHLFSKVSCPANHVRRIVGDREDAGAAAHAYEAMLKSHFKLRAGQFPRFDLVLLGMGADGHIASLFPGTRASAEKRRLAVPAKSADGLERVSLTLPVFNNASNVLMLVAGKDKAPMVSRVLSARRRKNTAPAQSLKPKRGNIAWLLDRSAAGRLTTGSGRPIRRMGRT